MAAARQGAEESPYPRQVTTCGEDQADVGGIEPIPQVQGGSVITDECPVQVGDEQP